MSDDLLEIGIVQAHYNVSYSRILKYSVEMYHKGLNEHKVITAADEDILDNKVDLQEQKWIEKWNIILTKRKNSEEKEANYEEANERTEEARNALEEVDNLLVYTLSVNDAVNWDNLKKKNKFSEKNPIKPVKKNYKDHPIKPNKESAEFVPKFTFLEKLFSSKKVKKINDYEQKYLFALSEWERQKAAVDKLNIKIEIDYEDEIRKWENEQSEWEKRKEKFLNEQKTYNIKIDEMKDSYLRNNYDSIVEYCEMVLNNSNYPDFITKNYEIEYNPDNKILIIEYELPALESLPKVKEVKYIASRKELKEYYISESLQFKMFDEAMYKITLRTIHELFEADTANAINAVSFNGWIKSINKATGKVENNCILSIQVNKSEFNEIDLANVDPKTCFRNLKGIASSKLSSITPIQPILQINKVDKRFIAGYDVVNKVDNSTNLALMDWEDFEHLIRELFEKEFKSNGGEVKVTQTSRDGGVDAVAFDPDPIRGGKIVIQAKRYTNTVGVSAVRDLYGTVLNEGATKGILVSTADYGPDAYDFAKGKPLTLLNGSNLLHLLEKHGHHAKIDLREAKKILSEKGK